MTANLFFLFSLILITFGVAYFAIIAAYCYAWVKQKVPTFGINTSKTSVSIIIAARNEEHTISNCLNSIIKQSYFTKEVELIIVDDHSSDDTIKEVQKIADQHSNIKLISIPKQDNGKKQAISAGIKMATGELIVTTDADCIMGPEWLCTIVNFFNQSNAQMIVSPVCFYDEKNGFEKMQSLEFMALMASSGASLYFNKAIMCNGANLAYTKKVFYEVNGFENIDRSASGDDVLLMYKIKRKYPKGVQFLKHPDALVFTKAKSTLKEFFNQRIRWASKGFRALNPETKIISLIVYLFNLLLLASLFIGFGYSNSDFHLPILKIGLILLGIKCIIDFLLLFLAGTFFNKKRFLIYFLPEQIVYILYIVLIGLFGFIGKYTWKDRNIKN